MNRTVSLAVVLSLAGGAAALLGPRPATAASPSSPEQCTCNPDLRWSSRSSSQAPDWAGRLHVMHCQCGELDCVITLTNGEATTSDKPGLHAQLPGATVSCR